jgi:primosomal protein N' (replication factor Y) (superfamily II helicase)
VLRCPDDDTPLTLHRAAPKPGAPKLESGEMPPSLLKCHTCGRNESEPRRCPACSSSRIRFLGIGTQTIEDELHKRFPTARVVRWDKDTASARDAADQMLRRFQQQQADVLVGTQMIAKGLDLPMVTLVGVVMADVGLFLPDFRASERVFDLLEQVAGRAGRSLLPGRVIVQSYNPEEPAIQFAARHDVRGFARHELANRRNLALPPFVRLVKFETADVSNDEARARCEVVARELRARSADPSDVIGPAACYFARRDRRYRWQVLARTPSPGALLQGIDLPDGVVIDVDPAGVL